MGTVLDVRCEIKVAYSRIYFITNSFSGDSTFLSEMYVLDQSYDVKTSLSRNMYRFYTSKVMLKTFGNKL